MKLFFFWAAFMLALSACTQAAQQRARSVLDAADLACVLLPAADGRAEPYCKVARKVDQCAVDVLDLLALDAGADR